MFAELPKLFDRDFAVGYFLPLATFEAISLWLIGEFGVMPGLIPLIKSETLVGATVLVLVSWLGGVILLALNRDIYMLKEGYGRFNPFRLIGWLEKQHYERLQSEISKVNEEYARYTSAAKQPPEELENRRIDLCLEDAERFPDDAIWLLPTAFGNTIRAFEVYPRVMYGMDAIDGWNRLLAVVPKDYRELVDAAKAQVDFWVNLWLVGLLIVLEYLALALYTHHLIVVWLPFVTLGLALIASARAQSAAVEWGDMVKAAFDLFLPELCKKLGFAPPTTLKLERQLWTSFSQAILYRIPSSFPKRSPQKSK